MSRIAIDLYQHSTHYPLPASILVSRSGRRSEAHTIARSLVTMPLHVTPAKPANEAVTRGQYQVEEFILRKFGWLTTQHEGQGRLVL